MSKQITKTNGFSIEVDDDGIVVTDTSDDKTLLSFSRKKTVRKQKGRVDIDIFDFPWMEWVEDQFEHHIDEVEKARNKFINTVQQNSLFISCIGSINVRVSLSIDAIKYPFDMATYNPNLGWKRQFISLTEDRVFMFEVMNASMFNNPDALNELLEEDVEVSAAQFVRGINCKNASGQKIANLLDNMPIEIYYAFEEYVEKIHILRLEVLKWTKGNPDHSLYRDTVYLQELADVNDVAPDQIKQWSNTEVSSMVFDAANDMILERIGISVLE